MEQLKEENTWLWRAYAESDKNGHDEYCGGKNNNCFWCQRRKAHPSIYSVTDEDIELFKVSCGKFQ
jgi:hypothetical protein